MTPPDSIVEQLSDPELRHLAEAALTKDGVQKAIRFLSQCIEGLQFEASIVRLATEVYRGQPFSNSILIHELAEAAAWERLGHDFASEHLHVASEEQRFRVREERNNAHRANPSPHLEGIRRQYQYLAAVGLNAGCQLTAGTALHFSIFTCMADIRLAADRDTAMRLAPEGTCNAKEFMLAVARHEPTYAALQMESFRSAYQPLQRTPLYELFWDEVADAIGHDDNK
jgi:hypothetical protein